MIREVLRDKTGRLEATFPDYSLPTTHITLGF
jgi:hypothetical protein